MKICEKPKEFSPFSLWITKLFSNESAIWSTETEHFRIYNVKQIKNFMMVTQLTF